MSRRNGSRICCAVTLSNAHSANRAGVLEPTVNRFCRSLGHRGFQISKYALPGRWSIQQILKPVARSP
ncbi:MAG TPA: hypothetical protein DEF72_06775, partial [Gammaproteobacteria bacterium]|nr:hypothetical protein [Gammaproteobacteria bacterium]